MKRLCLIIVLAFMMVLSACSRLGTDGSHPVYSSEKTDRFAAANGIAPTLILTETPWTGWTPEQPAPTTNTFEGITEGTVIYGDQIYGKITVDSLTDSIIEVKIDDSLFAASNDDGTINYFGQTLEKLTIPRGEEAVIASKTLDAGVMLTIRYE